MNRRNLLPLAMFLLVAAGALLPAGIAALDNSRLASRVDARPISDIHWNLRSERGIEDTLSIWAQNYMRVDLSQGGTISGQEAKARAEEVIELLAERGLLPACFAGTKLENIFPMAAFSKGESTVPASEVLPEIMNSSVDEAHSTVVIWCGSTPGESLNLKIYIDDATGKLVSVSYDVSEWGEMDLSSVRFLVNQWAEFLIEYYDLSDLRTADHLSVNQASIGCDWELLWNRDGQEIACPFTLVKRGNTVYINV